MYSYDDDDDDDDDDEEDDDDDDEDEAPALVPSNFFRQATKGARGAPPLDRVMVAPSSLQKTK